MMQCSCGVLILNNVVLRICNHFELVVNSCKNNQKERVLIKKKKKKRSFHYRTILINHFICLIEKEYSQTYLLCNFPYTRFKISEVLNDEALTNSAGQPFCRSRDKSYFLFTISFVLTSFTTF